MRRRSGVVSVGIALLTILSCRALFPGDETPAPGSPEAIPGFTRVTRGARALYENPSWSPDGQRIVYTRTEWGLPDPDPTTSEIYMMDLLTGGTRQLTWNSREDREPDWSPDGSRIVFVRVEESHPGSVKASLMTIASDGSDERILHVCQEDCWKPVWSPDGQQVAFSSDWIWLIAANGSDLRRLAFREFDDAGDPTWSPDGLFLAFSGSKEPYTPDMQTLPQVYLGVIDPATGQESVLAEADVFDPDWSPDGTRILFSSFFNDTEAVFAVPAAGGQPQRLIGEALSADLFNAAWSPDGSRVAMAYGAEGALSNLYILDLTVYHNGDLLKEASVPSASPEE